MLDICTKFSGAGEPDHAFIDDPNSDYVVPIGIESSLIPDGNRLNLWYHHGDVMQYGYTTDPALQDWTLVPENDLTGYYYPQVTKHPTNGLYYLTTCSSKATQGDIYMFSSPDKRTWTVLNGGNPVLTHNPSAAAWNYNLYNSSFLFIADTIYFCQECHDGAGGHYTLGLATSTLADGPNFNTNFTKIID